MRLKSLTDDPALLLVLAAASHRSFRPPWGHPRYPARDGGAERLVLSPKRLLERGFFVRHDEDVEGEPQQRAVDDEAPIAHQHRLTQDDGNDRDVYWIAHITVETGSPRDSGSARWARGCRDPAARNAQMRQRAQARLRESLSRRCRASAPDQGTAAGVANP